MKIPFKGFRRTGKIGIVGKWKYTTSRRIIVKIPQYWHFYYEFNGKENFAREAVSFNYNGKPLEEHIKEAEEFLRERFYKDKHVTLARVTRCGGDVIVRG
jgi:hypothetical protein